MPTTNSFVGVVYTYDGDEFDMQHHISPTPAEALRKARQRLLRSRQLHRHSNRVHGIYTPRCYFDLLRNVRHTLSLIGVSFRVSYRSHASILNTRHVPPCFHKDLKYFVSIFVKIGKERDGDVTTHCTMSFGSSVCDARERAASLMLDMLNVRVPDSWLA